MKLPELTEQQRQAVQRGEAVRLTDPDTQRQYVLVPAELYDQVQRLLYDDSPWTDAEMIALAWEAGKSIGWDTPEMAQYDDYEAHRDAGRSER